MTLISRLVAARPAFSVRSPKPPLRAPFAAGDIRLDISAEQQ